ncbi:MAG: carboxypeptidase regulatory-like domain-containing protein [Taibaiella sp.]|nr:carboxypeptidase regulatory-like domain-containing protein [Taibaiella sp.]MBX9449696.1 carboxypeptidase regulatory-like domain-containing protein [Taibaiella sp.]
MLKKFTLLAGAMTGVAIGIHAQVTTSSMDGFITTDGKEPAVGYSVKVVHTPSGSEMNTFTNEKGYFYVDGLRTGGPYSVQIEGDGYVSHPENQIYLVLGETYSLNMNLAGISAREELEGVVVFGTLDPVMNSNRTGASTNINNKTISRMPTISRSLTDFTRLTPQANGNGFAGRDGRYNNLQIDGANFNNAFGLSSDPLPGGSNQPISLDAIEEISVNIAPYDVRQTGFTGAGINAVTRSGTNEYEASIYTFAKPRSFSGLDIGEEYLDPGSRTSNSIYGGRFGMPIIKNKLFFFGSLEYEEQNAAGNNWIANDGSASGSNVTRVLKNDLEDVASYLKSNYGYDPGRYQGYANTYKSSNIKALARIDWNISSNHKLTVRFNLMNGSSQQGANASSGPNPRSSVSRISKESMVFEHGNYSQDNKVMSFTAELNSRLSDVLSNQFLATYSKINDVRGTTGDIFPFVDIWKDGSNYISFGTELFSYDNEVINNNITITDNLTYILDNHTFTGGLSFQTMSFGNSYKRMGTSYYRYNDLSTFLAGGKPDVYGVTYPYAGNDGYARVQFGLAGVYLQDKFNVSPWFNLTGGVRVDMPLFFNEPLNNPAIDNLDLLDKDGNVTNYNTGLWPKSTPLFSPRLGFNWDVLKNKTLQVRGGSGIFTGNIPFVWFTNMPTNSGMLQNTFEPVPAEILDQITHIGRRPHVLGQQIAGFFPQRSG